MKLGQRLLYWLFLSLFVFVILELFLYFAATVPSFGKNFSFRSGYFDFAIPYPQFDEKCGRFDPELGYTLKPGVCVFTLPDITTEVYVNSLGVRDDEESLEYPKVVVVGNSDSMGWGVNTDEVYTRVVEEHTGLVVLNTGLPSYGTVRQMRMLDRVDTSQTDFLVVQYNTNDYEENATFFEDKSGFRTMSYDQYKKQVDKVRRGYFFGRALYIHVREIAHSLRNPETSQPENHWEKFIYAIENAGVTDISRFHVVVLADSHLSMRKDLAETDLPFSNGIPKSFTIVAFNGFPIESYDLDPHYLPATHNKIGLAIGNLIKEYRQNPPNDARIKMVEAVDLIN